MDAGADVSASVNGLYPCMVANRAPAVVFPPTMYPIWEIEKLAARFLAVVMEVLAVHVSEPGSYLVLVDTPPASASVVVPATRYTELLIAQHDALLTPVGTAAATNHES